VWVQVPPSAPFVKFLANIAQIIDFRGKGEKRLPIAV